jgi:segregation and condensation protein B
MTLDAQIEAVLFWKGESMAVTKLATILEKTEEEIREALTTLEQNLTNRGLQLIHKENEVLLGTHAEMGTIIETLTKEELIRDLGKAGLETLSIILYRGPVARRDIDYIRGVNSNFILRNLLIRGLVEKVQSPTDQRSFIYKPTFQLLSYLGISKLEDLPEYASVRQEIDAREAAIESEESPSEQVTTDQTS